MFPARLSGLAPWSLNKSKVNTGILRIDPFQLFKNQMMIDNLPNLRTFVSVVAVGSLSAAARDMDLSLAMVSKRLAQLERELGVRLLQRTTRKQVLTEEGRLFHVEALRILAAIEQAEAVISGRSQTIDGTLRLSAPVELGRQWIAPAIAAFQKMHPKVRVQLELSDVLVDLLDAGIDLAIRFGSLADSSLIARPLAPNFRVLCASPDYLRQFGEPSHPDELIHHQCILIGHHARTVWTFEGRSLSRCRSTGRSSPTMAVRPTRWRSQGRELHASRSGTWATRSPLAGWNGCFQRLPFARHR